MDKCTIIPLLKGGRSKRSVVKKLNINRRTIAKYWEKYIQVKNQIALDPTDPSKKESLTA